jgi:hypothetical protein
MEDESPTAKKNVDWQRKEHRDGELAKVKRLWTEFEREKLKDKPFVEPKNL